jgi:hypothetical protein
MAGLAGGWPRDLQPTCTCFADPMNDCPGLTDGQSEDRMVDIRVAGACHPPQPANRAIVTCRSCEPGQQEGWNNDALRLIGARHGAWNSRGNLSASHGRRLQAIAPPVSTARDSERRP